MVKNETNKILDSVGIPPLQEVPQQKSSKSRLRAYAVAASIALSGVLGYGVGYYTNELRSSKQSVVQIHQSVPQPAPEKKITIGSITELADRYVLENVICRSKPHKVAWSKTYLDNGEYYTQDEHIEKMNKGDYGEWTIPDVPLYHASIVAVSGQKGELADKVKEMFKKDFNEWVMTSTRSLYRPKGLDKITHRFGHADEYAQDVALTGPDMWITPTSNCADAINAFLGTNNLAEVERVYTALTGKKPYVWRRNQRSLRNIERAVVFGVIDYDVWFNLDANGSIGSQRSARGVVGAKNSP